MFMKHYVPNSCLYIKVAKLRTGVGFAEMSHLQKFEAHSCYSFHDITITNFQSPNLQGEIIRKKQQQKNNNIFFLRFSPIDLLIILYQLTKFEAPSCYSFRDIIITKV